MTVLDLGHFARGSAPTFSFAFKQLGVLANPDDVILNVTLHGVKTNESFALSHDGTGTYSWTPVLTTSGVYTVTIYAPPGGGETAQPLIFVVDEDPNYP